MKYVLLAIFVLFAAQPLQVSSCDMSNGQGTDHNQHDTMNDTPMDHDDMQQMDCCDQDPAETGDGCGSMSHCGSCPTGVVAIQLTTFSAVYDSNPHQFFSNSLEPPNGIGSPPFRPPIA